MHLPKKLFIRLITVAFLQVFFCCCFSQKKNTIISHAKSSYHIVLLPAATAVEKEAAGVLQKYLSNISGCTLPVATEAVNASAKQLIIGNVNLLKNSDTTSLDKDGVLIKSIGQAIVFGGGRRKGVLYSVYTFLDSLLGCRMYAYDLSQIPKTSTIALPASIYIKQLPAFDYRMSNFINLNKSYCDFNKQNYLLEDWGLWVHSFDVLVPSKIYFASHPDYFSLINGKRNPGQLCLSNPAVLELLTENLRAKMKEKPDAKYWSVSQNDNELYCQCDACKKLDAEQGSHQGSILQFVNKVAGNFPDKTIVTLAYQYSQKPPASIAPASNVMIMLCNIYGDRSKPIMATQNNQFDLDLRGWQTLTANLFVWEYIVQFSHAWAPFPNLYTLQPNVQYFKARKVSYLFEEGFVNQQSEFSDLRAFLVSKLMWNEKADIKSLMHNFIQIYYGKISAPYIEQYIQRLTSNSKNSQAKLYIFGSPADQKNSFLTQKDIDEYKIIFQKALSGLTENDVYYKRVAKEYLCILFAELDINGAHITADNAADIANKTMVKKKLDDFYTLAKKLNVTYLSEDLKSIATYYKKTNQLLQP